MKLFLSSKKTPPTKGPLGSQSLSSKEEHLKETEGSSMNGKSYEKGRAS